MKILFFFKFIFGTLTMHATKTNSDSLRQLILHNASLSGLPLEP